MRMLPSFPLPSPLRRFALGILMSMAIAPSSYADPSALEEPSALVAPSAIAEPSGVEIAACGGCGLTVCSCSSDRIFLVSTRHLCHDACRAGFENVPLRIWRIDGGSAESLEIPEYHASLQPGRPVVIYVHGNRMPADELVARASSVRHKIDCRLDRPVDWVYFSWPSQRTALGVRDFREKADRCDAQGLYLATFLRHHVEAGVPLAMIGYSFGSRVVTGSLHALGGGMLGGRRLNQPPITGANVRVALVAAAIESTWLGSGGYHGQATKNMDRLMLLYNQRDAVLKRYWLLEKVRQETALGYSGPTCFAPRVDGTRLPVLSRDCSPSVRIRHAELDYYGTRCNAGCDMARMIDGIPTAEF